MVNQNTSLAACKWAVIVSDQDTDQVVAVFHRAAVAEDFIERCIQSETRPLVRIELVAQ